MPELDLGSVIGPQGPKGDKGIDGAVGPMGPQGEKGDDGAAASINGVNALTLETGDGLEATMNGSAYHLKLTDNALNAVQEVPTFVRPNLLDNWYFGRPVNQRGEKNYSTDWGYTIDRWQTSENSTLTVNNGSVSLTGSYFFEPFEEIVDGLKGKTVTVSLLFATGELEFATGVVPTTWGGWSSIAKNRHVGLQGIGEDSTRLWLLITDDAKNILAAKLELGPTQTLAHREGDRWVLNEIPDYGEQLRRCQRYAIDLAASEDRKYGIVGVGVAVSQNEVKFMVPLPTTMRARPVAKFSGTWKFVHGTDTNYGLPVTTISVDRLSTNTVVLNTFTNENLITGDTYMLWRSDNSNNSLFLSSDL